MNIAVLWPMAVRRFIRSCHSELQQLCQQQHSSTESEIVRGVSYIVTSTAHGRVFSAADGCNKQVEIVSEADLAQSTNYALVTNFRPSLCHSAVGYTFDTSGDELFSLRIARRLASGLYKHVCDFPKIANFVWLISGDNPRYCVATEQAPGGRADKFLVLCVATGQAKTILHEPDEGLFLDVAATKDYSWLTLNSNSRNDSQVQLVSSQASHLFNVNHAADSLIPLPAREEGVQYFIEHTHGHLLAITNREAGSSYSIMCHVSPPPDAAPADAVCRGLAEWANWRPLLPPQDAFKLEDVDVFRTGAVLYGRDTRTGLPSVQFASWRLDEFGDLHADVSPVSTPPAVASVEPGGNQDYDRSTATVHIGWSTAPGGSVELPLHATPAIRAQPALDTLHLPSTWPAAKLAASADYNSFLACEHVCVASRDGSADIPVTLVGRPEALHCRSALTPLLVNVYGAYGTPLDTTFDPSDMPWLLRGWVQAFVHARGGGERGLPWYHAGRQLRKLNTMHDLHDSIVQLHDMGLSRPELTVVSGSSAGGLPAAWMSHSEQQGPQGGLPAHSIAATMLSMPFLDVIRSMSDPSLPLTVPEYTEWGDPVADSPPGTAALMQEYCPQHLASTRAAAGLPAMIRPVHTFVEGAVNDPRTPVWHQRNYVRTVKRSAQHSAEAFHQPVPVRVWWPHDGGSVRSRMSGGGASRMQGVVLDLLGRGDAAPREVSTSPPQQLGLHLHVHEGAAGHHGAGGWDSAADDVVKQLLFAHRAVGLPCV